MTPSGSIPRDITRLQRPAVLCAVAGAILLVASLLITSATDFFRGYLTAWLFFLSLSIGAMSIVMLGHLIAGEWSILTRRFGEAAAMNLVVVAVLFIPILFGLKYLFPWADAELVRHDPILQHRARYFTPAMFALRAAIYFAVWLAFAFWIRRESLEHDRTGDPNALRRSQRISAGGLLIYFVTMTLASVDWILSRDPHWFSTIIGFSIVVAQAAGGMAFLVWIITYIAGRDPVAPILEGKHLNDFGNLLLTLVILWAYMSFAQFLIIWMGNSKEDVGWYVERGLGLYKHGWRWWGLMLIIFHFFVPFFVLLFRNNKRQAQKLRTLALWLLIMRFCDMIWLIMPTGEKTITWTVVPAMFAIGGVWFAVYITMLKSAPLLPGAASEIGRAAHDHEHAAHTAPAV